MAPHIIHATAVNRPGAIAILQLIGPCSQILETLTGIEKWPMYRARLADLDGIDEGLVVRLNDRVTQIMPHGGPRIVQRITDRLIELGAVVASNAGDLNARSLFPEAEDEIEAITMYCLARAESPLAVDLLLQQPRIWRGVQTGTIPFADEDRRRSLQLNHLITPPLVVLAGEPNVGKSTLSNALLGRAMSIAMNMPGTTRDYVTARIDLGGLVVDWHDTPGIRETDDVIERKAALLAQRLTDRADLLIAMRDDEHDWPRLPREPDVRIINKCDRTPNQGGPAGTLRISAETGSGIEALVSRIREALAPDLNAHRPWLFDPRLLKT